MRILHWFRTDLRISDNQALAEAISAADELLSIFIITPKTWQDHDASPAKIQFILNNLKKLSETLAKQGIPLLIKQVRSFTECSKVLQQVCEKYHIKALYFNKQYELDEHERDKQVIKVLSKNNIKVYAYDDQAVLPLDWISSKQGSPLKVFTPFKKCWLNHVAELTAWKICPTPQKKFVAKVLPDSVPNKIKEFTCIQSLVMWPPGETKAQDRLDSFCQDHLRYYHLKRDYPSCEGTSKLSPYLAQGVLSPRQCIVAMMNYLNVRSFLEILNFPGPATWLSELIWRDFYKYIMHHFPDVCRYKPFRLETERLLWRYDANQFSAWCNGLTGFPLVDAAMRQLNQTGWMHNRLRMVTAMFLAKVLFLDWREGERYFMQNLIDGDLAANNGGWQWCASTGTDAVPYFRIFNPLLQSKRYDPDAKFIKTFCPELTSLDPKVLHNLYQHAEAFKKINYPEPIVDYKSMRIKVMDAFKGLRSQ